MKTKQFPGDNQLVSDKIQVKYILKKTERDVGFTAIPEKNLH